MIRFRLKPVRLLFLLATILLGASFSIAQTARTPSDVVREFYKALHERRFKDAWSLTIYKPAVDDLNAEEMEDLRPGFEEEAARSPEQVEITSEQINGKTAIVFVKIPVTESTPQVTSEPVNLMLSPTGWIIGTEADAAEVKKAGRRYFIDGVISGHEADVEGFLKRLDVNEALYSRQHNGSYGDFSALISAKMIFKDDVDPNLLGYNFHMTLGKDGKSYVATAEPVRYEHTGRRSFSMDQTGLIKSADNGGKPLKP